MVTRISRIPWFDVVVSAALIMLASPPATAQLADSGVGRIAARQFFQEGLTSVREKDFPEAARKFRKAIRSDSTRPEYRAALSAVYVEQSQLKKAWNEARLAMKVGAGEPQVADQLFSVWNAFGADNLFLAGTVKSSVRNMLGEPDRVNTIGANERWFYDFMGIDWADGLLYSTIDLRGVASESLQPLSQLRLQPDSRWHVLYRVADRAQQTTHYVVSSDDAADSIPSESDQANPEGEMFVIQRLSQLAKQGMVPRKWMEQMQRIALRANPDIEWDIVEELDDRLIYEWRQSKTRDWPAHHEVALVMSDGRDLHYAAYSDATERLAPAMHDKWLEIFSKAQLHRFDQGLESIPAKSLKPAGD